MQLESLLSAWLAMMLWHCWHGRQPSSPLVRRQVPAEVLEWGNRSALLLEEILEGDADIIALQEVNHYGAHWTARVPACPATLHALTMCPATPDGSAIAACLRSIARACLGYVLGQSIRPLPATSPAYSRMRSRKLSGYRSARASLADDFLRPELEARGYRGAFLAKCSSPAMGYGYGADGCALFYRQERFEAVSTLEGEFSMPLDAHARLC